MTAAILTIAWAASIYLAVSPARKPRPMARELTRAELRRITGNKGE